MVLGEIIVGFGAICVGVFGLYLGSVRPLYPWSRNRLVKQSEFVDRIMLLIVGFGFALVGLMIFLGGLGLRF